jgi:uncharacterized protein (TIGR02099 family)
MIHLLKPVAAKIWASVLLLLVLAGVLVGSTRVLLPLVSEYREQLAADIGAAIDAPVRIGELGARLAGLSPELRLSGVEILDPEDGRVQLHFRELRLRLGVLESLRSGQPRIDKATLVGARLVLRRRADGSALMLGFASADRPGNVRETPFTPAPLLAEGRLMLMDSEIIWDNRELGLPPLHVAGVEAELVNAGLRHQLDIKGHIAGGAGRLELHADLFGQPETVSGWRGEIYCRLDDLELGPWLRPLLPDFHPLDARAELELWSRWGDGLPRDAQARLALADVRLGDSLLADHLSATLQWERRGEADWRLGLSGLEVWRGRRTHLTTDLTLWSRGLEDGRQWQLGLQRLRLDDARALADRLPLPAPVKDALAHLQPRGELGDLRVMLNPGAVGGAPRWQAAGRLRGLALRPYRGAPGVQGLDLAFSLDQDRGTARLASTELELEFPGLFRWPLEADRLGGELRWRSGAQGIELQSEEILLDTPDLVTRSRLRLRVPSDGSPPFLDMQTDFRDGDGSATSRYLPVGIISDELVRWLDRAIVSGRVPSGSFLFRGHGDAFPFYQAEGKFQVLFGVSDTIVDYQDGWPRLEELLGEVHFHNQALDILVQEGGLLESRVSQVQVWLPDLDDARHVFLKGTVSGPFADGFRILRETPLAASKARYVAGMAGRGSSDLRLDLAIPLDQEDGYRIDGELSWRPDARLLLVDPGLSLERLQGSLKFNERGVFSERILARLWDLPITARVHTDDGAADGEPGTRIDLGLPLSPAVLDLHYPHALWSSMRGTAPARLTLEIAHDERKGALPVRYRLQSDLLGIDVDLPAPLGKPADVPRELFVAGNLPVSSGEQLQLGYGDIRGALRFKRDPGDARLSVDAGVVQCGTRDTPRVKRRGFLLAGRLSELDAGGWVDWLAAHASPAVGDRDERLNPSQRVDLAIDRMVLPRWALNEVRLGLLRTPNAWEVDVRSRELEGTLRLPDGGRDKPLSAQLKHLRLDPEQWSLDSDGQQAGPWLDPRHMRGLYLSVEELYLGGRPFGRLDFKAKPVAEGVQLQQLSLDGPLLTLTGEGSWLGDGQTQRTMLDLKGGAADLGKTLGELNFTTALGSAAMDFQASVDWPAPLLQPPLEQVQGELRFHIGAGRILDVDPGVGRLFGLLNLGALNRRLTLDFTDLFKEGYAFDSIDAHFVIGAGNARAEKVAIVGPGADIEISGRTGLLARDYDQMVTVTPEISTALPLAGGLAGGPVVAAALLLAEQVMGEEVNKLIRYHYRVTGPWDQPQIERVETQDQWSLSNMRRPADAAALEDGGFVH